MHETVKAVVEVALVGDDVVGLPTDGNLREDNYLGITPANNLDCLGEFCSFDYLVLCLKS
jgi:hypothetical protein